MSHKILSKAYGWLNLAWYRIRYPLSSLFAWTAIAVGLIGGGIGLLDSFNANATAREWVLSIALGAIAIGAITTLAVREFTLTRQSKFVSILTHLERASNSMRDVRIFLRLKREIGSATKEDLSRARSMIEDALSAYADAFSILASTRCRTCVKLVNIDAATVDDVVVFALARDKFSAVENKKHDKKRADGKLDKLKDNSDFLRLWDQSIDDEGYFISNDLKHEKEYETSSLNYWRNVAGNPNRLLENDWPLPYRSTIVWPIRREIREDLGIVEEACLGFLTVDSRVPGIFIAAEHAPLGRLLANALFPVVDLYNQLQS